MGEITAADLVLHVADRSHPQWHDQMRVSDEVLDGLGGGAAPGADGRARRDLPPRLPQQAGDRGGGRGSVFLVDDNFIGNKREALRLLPDVTAWRRRAAVPRRPAMC